MPFFYDHVNTLEKHHPSGIVFSFNDEETDGETWHWHYGDSTEYRCKYVEGSAGASTVVTLHGRECLVEDYFISVVCEDVEAFVRNQKKEMYYIKLEAWKPYRDQKVLETIINRMCRCLENSLQSRTEKLKVQNLSLPVLKISQAISAVNLLDRDFLSMVTVDLPFEDQVFTAEDLIPLMERQGWRRLGLTIQLHKFSPQVLEEVRKFINCTSKQLNLIIIKYQYIDEECYKLIEEATFCKVDLILTGEIVFGVNDFRDQLQEITMRKRLKLKLSDNTISINIFEVPLIMRSIASHLGCPQIQSLRKVSRGIRQCVDYVEPDPHILSYYIWLGNSLRVRIDSMMNRPIWAHYKGSLEQDAVQIEKDFDLNTRHQKSCMDELYIEMFKGIWKLLEEDHWVRSMIFIRLKHALMSRTSPLKVRKLTLITHWQCLLMEILPYLDAEYLESISIQRIRGIDEECTIDLDEIIKTEQWVKAKELCMKTLTARTSIQDMNILNFETIDISMETMSPGDITYCRKASCFEWEF
ncbi:hypothetical protein GCK72_021126 [Caenorhabditis remanei]|uniref:DUF38 domain-containing protein n=1 Tax=Caenorhabditis remanei TaxID=31234 RepID=A0A6A5GIQ5_CAERE|nr:hypothetical protein GCK72_021126 [Caenorhabditis remanei]KAF1754563.1 hypothetical protein GCK72_021126 [Caenorhabditis remanei]